MLLMTLRRRSEHDTTRRLSGSIENQVKIWDVKSGRELRTLTSFGATQMKPVSMLMGACWRRLDDGRISLWDTASGSKLRDLTSSPWPTSADEEMGRQYDSGRSVAQDEAGKPVASCPRCRT